MPAVADLIKYSIADDTKGATSLAKGASRLAAKGSLIHIGNLPDEPRGCWRNRDSHLQNTADSGHSFKRAEIKVDSEGRKPRVPIAPSTRILARRATPSISRSYGTKITTRSIERYLHHRHQTIIATPSIKRSKGGAAHQQQRSRHSHEAAL